jgi:serine/threonine protein kinase
MSFEPYPEQEIQINGETIRFLPLEKTGARSAYVYAQSGKEGTVYKVRKGSADYALKVFYPAYQDKRLLENTQKISKYKHLQGFKVADRTVLNKKSFPNLVIQYPELDYAVLMPWIDGVLWTNLTTSSNVLDSKKYFRIARLFINLIGDLEKQGVAHCDLSNNNFIVDPKLDNVELIDVEDMYAPDMPRPVPDISYGTMGYRTKWIAENGLWGPASDRFAGAILCSEIITWHNKEIRDHIIDVDGDYRDSYFDEGDMGSKNNERYQIMRSCLSRLNEDFTSLFDKAWFSKNVDECPPISEWMAAVNKLDGTPTIISHPQPDPGTKGGVGARKGLPPKIVVSDSVLDFGLLNSSDNRKQFTISNTGSSVLIGEILPASWLETSVDNFSVQPNEHCQVDVLIKSNYPKPQSGSEYRSSSALLIESNAGTEVVEVNYKTQKPPFYKNWFVWFLVGVFVIFLANFPLQNDSSPESVAPIVAATTTPTPTATLKPTKTLRPTSTPRPTATKAPPSPTPASLGQAVKYKSIEISVLDVYRHDNLIPGNGYRYWATDGHMIIDLVVKVKNTGSTPTSIKWSDTYVIDSDRSRLDVLFAGFRRAADKEKVDPLSIDYNDVNTNMLIEIKDTVYMRIVYIITEKPEQTVVFGIGDSPLIGFSVKK